MPVLQVGQATGNNLDDEDYVEEVLSPQITSVVYLQQFMEGKDGAKCSSQSAQLHLPRVDQAYLDMTAGRKEDADFAGAPAILCSFCTGVRKDTRMQHVKYRTSPRWFT